ncbi:MAG: Calx-beta domain-containing protein [Parvularculaceae bacterium]
MDEQRGLARVVVQRRFSSAGVVTVNYSTANGSALAGVNYYATSGTLVWQDGDSADKEILIPVVPDLLAEGAEFFTLTLSNISGGKIDPVASEVTVNLLDPGQHIAAFKPGFFNTVVYSVLPSGTERF